MIVYFPAKPFITYTPVLEDHKMISFRGYQPENIFAEFCFREGGRLWAEVADPGHQVGVVADQVRAAIKVVLRI